MTILAREWLPWDAMSHRTVQETLDQAIAQWNVQWFTTAGAEVAGTRLATTDARPEGDGMGWRVYRAAVAVRTNRGALSRLVNRSLDLRADATDPTAADRYVLDELGVKILESLVETVEVAFSIPGQTRPRPSMPADPFSDDGGVLVSLADTNGRETLTLALPSDAIFRHLKAVIIRAPRAAALPPLVEALAAVHIPVEARIGEAELTLAELNELAVGDVLVLDRRLGQAVDIAGVRSHDVFAKATLTHVEEGFALVFSA